MEQQEWRTCYAFASPIALPHVRKRATLFYTVHCVARHPPSLPPLIPKPGTSRQRAIELLGHATQCRASDRVSEELITLIGVSPPSIESAISWKAGLQRLSRSSVKKRAHKNTHFQQLRLPDDRKIGRVQSLLDVTRRTLAHRRILPTSTSAELLRVIGVVPQSEAEALRLIRTLGILSRRRRRSELSPPQLPYNEDELSELSMLLGCFAHRGSVGRKTETLRDVLGALPRTKNVAASWKKIVDARRRKLLRRRKTEEKRKLAVATKQRKRAIARGRRIIARIVNLRRCFVGWVGAVLHAI